jgi:hypothetical protein
MAALPVHVTANIWVGIDTKNNKVTPNETNISKSGRHEVEWYCLDPNASATVKFAKEESPFLDSEFHVPAGGTACSGPARPDAAARNYSFQVFDSTGVTLQLSATSNIIIIKP